MPSECGVMSTSTAPTSAPAMMAAWIAAPMATHRSGLTSWWAGWPSRSSSSWLTSGVRVLPPTSTTLSICRAGQVGIVQGPLHAVHGAVQQRLNQLLVLLAADLHVQVQRLAVLLGDELLLDAGERVIRQLPLGRLDGPQHAGLGDQVGAQIDAVLLPGTVADVLEQQIVEVVAAELRVAVAGQHLDDAFLGLHDGHVEGAAAEVVDEHAAQLALAGVVGQRGGGRLVEDAHHFQPGQLAGLARRLALGVVEVGGHGDDRLVDRLPELRARPGRAGLRRIMAEISCGRYS